ncbi:cyclopropane-fatty-acyl-phospholipid synthase family protein [Candidatus Sororendozoicomonas aggregata]|uniref:cyclopropane-fatty-acyl-phospholipid synthase family protein n=1 Tax=Candidatus Sororendozoicomonas aggregata TaxID=3073239 RepID=UPI002ED07F34
MDSTNALQQRRINTPASLLYRWLIRRLKCLPLSRLELVQPDGQVRCLGVVKSDTPVARIKLLRYQGILKALRGGMMGWSEAYVAKDWDTPDLFAVTDWAMANEEPLESAFLGIPVVQWINRLTHCLRNNTRRGSRKNIQAHYDLGNTFYQHWLDKSMTYSSGLYLHDNDSLEQAQRNKYQRIITLLGVDERHQVLEIGCGWGGFARQLALQTHAQRYTGITLSQKQLDYARTRLPEQKGEYHFLLQDYRDLGGSFDRIVSIEMIEAVGEKHWPDYFTQLNQRLKKDGYAVVQAITIADERFEQYRKGTDFIQKYIFPGGFLPSDQSFRQAAKNAGLHVIHAESFGVDYARTLRHWHKRFNRHWPEIASLGFDDGFRRMWNYYFAYCHAGFQIDSINVRLYVLKHQQPSAELSGR